MISSQDYRNAYDRLYNEIRLYLWPYDVLETLAQVEVNIYSAFIDKAKLELDFNRLCSDIKDVCAENVRLAKACDKIRELLDETDENTYMRLSSVKEVNPNEDKQIKTSKEDDGEEQHEDEFREASY